MLINNESLSNSENRAKRLIRLRNMANLSRQVISKDINCSIETYKGWELARFGGLSLNGAKKVIARISQENIICTVEWLFNGEGVGPYILPFSEKNINNNKNTILDEISFFASKYENATFFQINDDAMSPLYEKNDYVAGIKSEENDIKLLIDKPCIVQTIDGRVLVRMIKISSVENCYTLYSTNINTTAPEPIVVNTQLIYAALIIRKYTPL